MKRIKLYIIMFAVTAAGLALTSCDDDFMNEVPQTSMTIPGYFNTVSDLQTYANNLYNQMPDGGIRDANSDNATGKGFGEANEVWDVLYGTVSKDNAGSYYNWDNQWGSLRTVNVLLDNADRVKGNEIDIKHWKAFGYYFRAIWYINMLQRYSDLPWIEHAMASDDPDVRRPSDPRAFVVENIMKDLDYASKNLKDAMGNKTRVHKYCALALLSRFALYEGTYRKYHDELNLQSTANEFLTIAASASKQIIDSRLFDITVNGSKTDDPFTGIKGSPAFRALFNTVNLGAFSEMIQWREYNSTMNGAWSINPTHFSLSRALMENFLTYPDGKPFSTVSGYATKPAYEGFAGRDPRLAETFGHPGSIRIVESGYKMPLEPYKGGFPQGKFEAYRLSSNQTQAFEGKAIYRYAEVILNYAEAKAELNQFDAEARDQVNKLRNRVNMPAFDADREVDQTLKDQYPNVTSNTVLALRRERRSELACEGLRLLDVYRWAAGNLFLREDAQRGMYLPALGLYDYNGDGSPDIGIYANRGDIPADYNDKSKYPNVLNWYFIKDTPGVERGIPANETGYVDGYLRRDESGLTRRFRIPTDYYRPISVNVTGRNPGLTQMFDWKN